ncbi:MAG: hypothetical protein BWY78_00022 [Alphaproteobacteria bacterium ADurb.Bin438]|nr:MAG: hypothetical protein BWY78_00022 [Alphaproteobacteria bacterium ADurb.Bin438]
MSDAEIKEVMQILNFFNQGETACDYAFNEELIKSFVSQNKK